jgi:hypothetical protein
MMKHTLTLLTALLLAPLAALHAADKPASLNPNQVKDIDANDNTSAGAKKALPDYKLLADLPPKLCPNPGSIEAYARVKRTCTGVPSIAVSRGGRIWVAWYSGTTGTSIERCPQAYVVVSTSGDGGRTWKEVLVIDPDGDGPLKAFDPRPWIDPDGKLWMIWHHSGIKHAWAVVADDADKENPVWSAPRRIAKGVMINKPVIRANFGEAKPNDALTEINIRPCVFFPEKTGLSYITVDGLHLMHSAENWQPPCVETQMGMIGPRGGKHWLIQNCRVTNARCVGIVLGEAAGVNYDDIDAFGGHIVRNNIIRRCGHAGIVGQKGAAMPHRGQPH